MILKSAEETIELGEEFAKTLQGGEILALTGDLGSGKTTFLKGLAEGLKVSETVTSPTFVILKKYQGKIEDKKIDFIHIDAYRLETEDDIELIGLTDFFGSSDVIVAIEWAEKIKNILPQGSININFKHINEKEREIDINN